MPAAVGTGSRTTKCDPLRNSGLRMSLAWSSGNSSKTASPPRTSNGSRGCARHGTVVPSATTTHRILVCFVLILGRALRYPIPGRMGRLKMRRSRCNVERDSYYGRFGDLSRRCDALFEQLNLSGIQTVVRG